MKELLWRLLSENAIFYFSEYSNTENRKVSDVVYMDKDGLHRLRESYNFKVYVKQGESL